MSFGVVLVTTASAQEAQAIAQEVLECRLGACVNIFPVQSLYLWQEQLENAQEWQLVIKTDLSIFPALQEKIRQIHSYEVPEIIALPIIAGSSDYLDWIGQNVRIEG